MTLRKCSGRFWTLSTTLSAGFRISRYTSSAVLLFRLTELHCKQEMTSLQGNVWPRSTCDPSSVPPASGLPAAGRRLLERDCPLLGPPRKPPSGFLRRSSAPDPPESSSAPPASAPPVSCPPWPITEQTAQLNQSEQGACSQRKRARLLPDGAARAGCGRGLFGGRGHGALVLFAERVRCSGRGVRADGRLHAGADSVS